MPDAKAVSSYFTSSLVFLRPFFPPVFLFSGLNLFVTIKTILLKVVILEESALNAVEAATEAVIGKSLFKENYIF